MATKTERAGSKLAETTKELGADFSKLFKPPDIADPEQGLYGVMQQGYAGALKDSAATDPGGGGADFYALGAGANRDRYEYAKQLEATRQAQLLAQIESNKAGLTGERLRRSPETQFIGESQGFQRTPEGDYKELFDPKLSGDQNANIQTKTDDEHLASVMGSFGEAAKAGYYFDPGIVSQAAGSLNAPDRYSGLVNVIGLPNEPGVFQTVAEKEKERNDRETERVAAIAAVNKKRDDQEGKITLTNPSVWDPNTGQMTTQRQWTGPAGIAPAEVPTGNPLVKPKPSTNPPAATAPATRLGVRLKAMEAQGGIVAKQGENFLVNFPSTGLIVTVGPNGDILSQMKP